MFEAIRTQDRLSHVRVTERLRIPMVGGRRSLNLRCGLAAVVVG